MGNTSVKACEEPFLERLKNGDEVAFSELVNEHWNKIYNRANSLLDNQQVDSEEFMRNLPKAIDALPPKYAQVIKMRNEQDLSYEEIASALNISVGTVKSRLSRAREYLRDELCKIV